MLKEINHKSGTQQALDRVAQAVRAGKRPDDAQEFMTPLMARLSNPAWTGVEAMAVGRFLAD
jgi:hypothetical protein